MAMMTYLARVQFEFGAIALLPEELGLLGIRRPLLVTDAGVRAAGIADRVIATLTQAPPVFDGTPSNPTEEAVLAALALYRGEDCDGLIALGGGSAIDLAKAVGLLATHPGGLADYTVRYGSSERIGRIAPLLSIPTAAGTGAEVGRAASVTLANGHKTAAAHPNLISRTVICDPELTLSLPTRMTAATGMDALSHGVETFLSTRVHPPAEAIALDCVARCAAWLRRAHAQPRDREARWNMMMAALEGGLTLQKGLGAVHAASHPLGALDLHHGEANAVMMPATLRFNEAHAAEKFARLRRAAGLADGADLAEWAARLTEDLGLPTSLAAMGVREDQLDELASEAAGEYMNDTNPKPASVAEYRVMFVQAFAGGIPPR